MLSHRIRSLINIACFVMVLTVNYLANALPINGVTQKELSAEYHIHLTPAGYVFAIWGVIYLAEQLFLRAGSVFNWVRTKTWAFFTNGPRGSEDFAGLDFA